MYMTYVNQATAELLTCTCKQCRCLDWRVRVGRLKISFVPWELTSTHRSGSWTHQAHDHNYTFRDCSYQTIQLYLLHAYRYMQIGRSQLQWNFSIAATLGERHYGRYTGVAVLQGFGDYRILNSMHKFNPEQSLLYIVAVQGWQLRGVPLYMYDHITIHTGS